MKPKAKRYKSGGDVEDNFERGFARERSQSDRVRLDPHFLALDKGFRGAGGRLSYEKNLDKNSSIQAYVDAMVGKPSGQSAFVMPQRAGIEYRRSFSKGGMTTSKRADGIAQRGKTRGKIV
jgi:hypothetical protein